MGKALIKGGRIVTAVDDYVADILVDQGRIEAIAREIPAEDVPTYDATGLMVFPGGIDVHVHMETPMGNDIYTCDTFETGTKSAAFGGTTTIVDFAQQFHGESPKAALDRRLAAAEPQCNIDYGFHVILTDVNKESLAALPDLINQDGVSSFKLYMAYPGVLMVDDADIYRTMRKVGIHGGMVNLHAENGVVIQALIEEALEQGNTSPKYHMLTRPSLMEGEATHRVIRIAELAEVPVYIVHLSAEEALEAVVEARDRGIHAFAETCPHYLFLTNEEYDRPGFDAAKFVMTPPCGITNANMPCGAASSLMICNWSRRITAPSALTKIALAYSNPSSWAKTIFPKFPTAHPASSSACRCCMTAASIAAASPSTALCN
jgi:dihydropyrimidinase